MNFTTRYATLVVTDYYAAPFGKLLDGEIVELMPVKLHYWGRKLLWAEVFEEDIYFTQFFPIVRITELIKHKIPIYQVIDIVTYTPDPEGGEGVSSVCEMGLWSHAPAIPYVHPLTAWQMLSQKSRKQTLKNLQWTASKGDVDTFQKLLAAALKCGYKPNKKAREYYKRVYLPTVLTVKKQEKQEKLEKLEKQEKKRSCKNSKPKGKRPWRETRKENRLIRK